MSGDPHKKLAYVVALDPKSTHAGLTIPGLLATSPPEINPPMAPIGMVPAANPEAVYTVLVVIVLRSMKGPTLFPGTMVTSACADRAQLARAAAARTFFIMMDSIWLITEAHRAPLAATVTVRFASANPPI